MSLDLKSAGDGVIVKILAVAGARREGVVGIHGDALKLATTAAPEKGRANRRLLAVLADALRVPRREVELVSGATAREKKVLIRSLTVEELLGRLAPHLP